MTDHQQAAIEAGAQALFVMQHRVSANVFDKGDYKALKEAAIRESTNALAAAEPHLRAKWAGEARELLNMRADFQGPHTTARNRGIHDVISLLEGAGE